MRMLKTKSVLLMVLSTLMFLLTMYGASAISYVNITSPTNSTFVSGNYFINVTIDVSTGVAGNNCTFTYGATQGANNAVVDVPNATGTLINATWVTSGDIANFTFFANCTNGTTSRLGASAFVFVDNNVPTAALTTAANSSEGEITFTYTCTDTNIMNATINRNVSSFFDGTFVSATAETHTLKYAESGPYGVDLACQDRGDRIGRATSSFSVVYGGRSEAGGGGFGGAPAGVTSVVNTARSNPAVWIIGLGAVVVIFSFLALSSSGSGSKRRRKGRR